MDDTKYGPLVKVEGINRDSWLYECDCPDKGNYKSVVVQGQIGHLHIQPDRIRLA